MFHRILVALDNSDFGQSVFAEALSIARAIKADLMLLHVLSDLEVDNLDSQNLDTHFDQLQSYRGRGTDLLATRQASAKEEGVNAEVMQTPGAAPSTICSVAQSWNADLIIVGHHELSGLKELVRGSVSSYVMHHATCSVMTVQG